MTIDLDEVDLAQVEAHLVTDKGTMVFGFRPDQAPAQVRNFLELSQKGFYDGLAFHRVVKNFMIQGGCPHTREGARGTPGTGGPGHSIHAEFSDLEHRRGALSMARFQDPNSAGSQFFVVHAEHADSLDGQYTMFGQLKDGFDVLDAIANVDVEFGDVGERSRPKERVGIERITLAMAPVEVEAPEATPEAAPKLSPEATPELSPEATPEAAPEHAPALEAGPDSEADLPKTAAATFAGDPAPSEVEADARSTAGEGAES